MNLLDQIKKARASRAKAIDDLKAMVTTAEEGDRSLTEDEQKSFDDLKKGVADLDERIERLQATHDMVASTALPVTADDANDNASSQQQRGSGIVISRSKPAKIKGAFFAKQAHLLFVAGGNHLVAADYAEKTGDKEMGAIMRAAAAGATSTAANWATELVQQEIQDFFDLLRPLTVFARITPGSTVDFSDTNSIKIPKLTTGVGGGFLAEGGAIPVKAGAFGTVTMTPKKMGVITVATREVLSRSSPALETILRNAMLRDTATVLDRTFLSSNVAASGAPDGLFHTNNAPATITPSNTANAGDDAIADIKAVLNALFTANVPITNPVWIMHPSKRLDLMALRSATGSFYFRDEMAAGTLQGYPVLTSTAFDFGLNNGGATNIKTLALIDADLLVKGAGLAPTIALSQDAMLHMDTVPNSDILVPTTGGRSMFQTDSTAIRLTLETDWRTLTTVAVAYVHGVNW
jgi:HK97 family phage major capsid protein